MRRRAFITLLGGATAAWPLTARAQQPDRVRQIGVLMNFAADDPQARALVATFLQGLSELGWHESRTLQIDIRWGTDDAETSRTQAKELLALAPDVILATTTSKVQVLRQASRILPIVFAGVSDPVGSGLVASLARPGGNITGFALPEYGISVKWLELLKEIAPRVARIGVLSGSGSTPGVGQLAAIQAVAPSMRVDFTPLVVSDADEIEATVRAFSSGPNGGLAITTGTVLQANRDLIIKLAARYGLPAVYPFRRYARDGGLLFYGADVTRAPRKIALAVDRGHHWRERP